MMVDCINSIAHRVMVMNNTNYVRYPFIDTRYQLLYRNFKDKDDKVHLSELGYRIMLMELTEFIIKEHEWEKLLSGQGSQDPGVHRTERGVPTEADCKGRKESAAKAQTEDLREHAPKSAVGTDSAQKKVNTADHNSK